MKLVTRGSETREALLDIEADHPDWWFFPQEQLVQGFHGNGKIFIVGDQPSTDPWEQEHPHRRAFYDLLAEEKAGDSHLTDLYKRRGWARELKKGLPRLPRDFNEHRKTFLREVELLRPSTILALGVDAYHLLQMYVPELRNSGIILKRVWHFGTVRHGKRLTFQRILKEAIKAARQTQCNGRKSDIAI